MSKKVWMAGLLIAALVVGAAAVWALPGRAEAQAGGGQGWNAGETAACSGATEGAATGDCGAVGNVAGIRGQGIGSQGNGGPGQGGGGRGRGGNGGGRVSGSLTEAEVSALTAALQDEHVAKSLYEQAIADLGSVSPFAQIVRAEDRHIAALEKQFTRHGLAVPTVAPESADVAFATLAEACAAAADAEQANAALYDELLTQTEDAALTRVFTRLQSASLNQHLPAFEACAQ